MGVPDDYSAYSSRIVLEDTQRQLSAVVAQALEIGVQSESKTLLLDIDAYKLGDFPNDANSLAPLFAELRQYKNQIFFGSLRDEFASTFE
jgi:uncharacterized protein (TIGR04255 family)